MPPLPGGAVDCGQIVWTDGALSSPMIVPSCGLAAATASSSCALEHDSTTRPRRIGPCASAVEKIALPAWLTTPDGADFYER